MSQASNANASEDVPPSSHGLHESGVHPLRRERVLLVDDEPQVLVALEDLLADDFVVLTASSAERALDLVAEEPEIAVIISDQRMPKMNGADLFVRLNSLCEATRILVTGFADLDAVVRAVNEGQIYAYVPKPWDPSSVRVTVQRGAEYYRLGRQLAAERQLLLDLMNSIPDGIFFKNRELQYLRANHAFARMLRQATPEGLVGKHLADLLPDRALAEEVEREERALLESGQVQTDLVRDVQCEAGRRHFSVTKAPIRSAAGPVVGLVGIARDVTDRTAIEDALRLSEERLRLTFEGSKAGLFDWDIEREHVVYSSSFAALFGQDEKTLPPSLETLLAQVHPEDQARVSAALRSHLEDRETLNGIEFRALMVGDKPHWFQMHGQARWRADGVATRLVGSIIDITPRRAQAEHLARLSRLHAVLSGINGAIVRTTDRSVLLDECCGIAVSEAKLQLAAVIRVSKSGAPPRVSHAAGATESTISAWNELLADTGWPLDHAVLPTLEGGRHVVVNDLDAAPLPSGAGFLDQSPQALALFPLFRSGELDSVLVLFAAHVGFFDQEQVKLLNDLAENISFALDHFAQAERLRFIANFDELTGLPNRELLVDRVNQALAAHRNDGGQVALVLLDLDRFRQVNETLGRHAGDRLLLEAAERLGSSLDADDTLARIDGNCFAVLSNIDGNETSVAHKLEGAYLQAFSQPFLVNGTELRVSVRSGIAISPADGDDADALLANAEAALKKAKSSGQRWLFYAPNMNTRVTDRLLLETKLRRALEREEFLLHYQPKVDLKTRRIVGLEALIRWLDPTTGLVPPGKFIPTLEETGMIAEVGRWVLERAARQFTSWHERGIQAPRIAVNVSALQLAQADFLPKLERVLELYPLSPSGIDLEITESVLMEDFSRNVEKLHVAKRHGLKIAIDDFGTGYSSLGYLSKLPIDALKIDRSFVLRMTEDPQETTIVMTILSLAHSLDLIVVAEGVETSAQAHLLRLLKCDQIQGYLVAKPQPAEEIERMLSQAVDIEF